MRLDDRGGSSYKNWHGFSVGEPYWDIDVVVGGLSKGGARATVLSAPSLSHLSNGYVCYSGGPTDTTTIY